MRGHDIKIRIFVGGRPLEELTPEEREQFAEKTVRRIGEGFQRWFNAHPEEYEKI